MVVVAGAGVVPVAGAVIMEPGAGAEGVAVAGISMRWVVGACPGPGKIAGWGAVPAVGTVPSAGAEDNGAPTAISQRWPGWPCGGFKGPLAAEVAGAGVPAVMVLPGITVVEPG